MSDLLDAFGQAMLYTSMCCAIAGHCLNGHRMKEQTPEISYQARKGKVVGCGHRFIMKCLYTPHFLTPVGVNCIFLPVHPTAMTSIPIINSAIPKKRDTKTAPA